MIVYLKKKKKNIFRYVQISQPIMTLITSSPHTHTHIYHYVLLLFFKKKKKFMRLCIIVKYKIYSVNNL